MRDACGSAVLVSGALISFSSAFHIQRPGASLLPRTPGTRRWDRSKRTQSSAAIEVIGEAVERGDEEAPPLREILRDEIERPNGGEQVITIEGSTGEAAQADDVKAAKNDEKFKGSPEAVQVEQTREGEQEVIATQLSTGEVAQADGFEAAKNDKELDGSPEAVQVEQSREQDVRAKVSEGESTSAVVGDERSPPAVSTVTATEAKAVPEIIESPPNLTPSPSTDDSDLPQVSQSTQPSQIEEIGDVMTRSDSEPEQSSRVQAEMMIEKTEEAESVGKVPTSDLEETDKVVAQGVIESTESSLAEEKTSSGTGKDTKPLNEGNTAETIIESSAISQGNGDMKSASDDVVTQATKISSELKAAPGAEMPVEAEPASPESLPSPTSTNDQTTQSNPFSWSGGKVMDIISGKDITSEPAPTKETQYLTQQVASPFSTFTVPASPFSTLSVPASPFSTLSVPSVDLNDSGVLPILFGGITFMLAIVGFVSRQTAETESVNEGQEGEGEPSPISKAVEKTKNLVKQVKDAGKAGAISYALWEALFWGVSIPLGLLAYATVEGRWLDLTDSRDLETFGFACFCYANIARFALPLRIGIALSTAPWVQENILDKFEVDSVETSILNGPVEIPPTSAPPTLVNNDEKEESGQGSSPEPLTKITTPPPAFGLSKNTSSLPSSPDFDEEKTPPTKVVNSARDEVTAGVAEVTSQSDKIAEEMLDSTRQRSKTNDDRFSRPNGASPPTTESPLQQGSPLEADSTPDESTKPQIALPAVGSTSSLSSQISDTASDELASEMLDSSRGKATAKVNGGSTFIMPNGIDGDGADSSETESPIGEDDPWTAIAKSQESHAKAKAKKPLSSDTPNGAGSDIVESYKSASSFGGFNDKIFNGQSKPATPDNQPYLPSSGTERNTPAIAKRLDLSSQSPTRAESQSLKSPKDDTSNVNGENEAITTGDEQSHQEESTRGDEADDRPPLLYSRSQTSSAFGEKKGLSVNGSSGVDLSPIPASFAAVDSQIQESALKGFDIDPSLLAKKREPIIELEEYW